MRTVSLDVVREDRSAEHQDQVAPLEAGDDLLAVRRQKACEEGVLLGKAVAGREGTHPHGGLVSLGESDDFLPGPISGDRGADDDHRAARGGEHHGRAGQHRGVAGHRDGDLAPRRRGAQPVPVIDRHRHEGRPTGRLHGGEEGAGHRRRHVLGARGLAAPLDVRPRQIRGLFRVEEGLERQDRARLLPGRDDERRLVAIRREQAPDGVSDADGRVQVHERGGAARLCEPVRHGDHHRLLQPEHVAEIGGKVAEHRQLRRARIAEDGREADVAQQREHRLANRDAHALHDARTPSGRKV